MKVAVEDAAIVAAGTFARKANETARGLVSRLAQTSGVVTIDGGVLWFEDGTSVDLSLVATRAAQPMVVLTIESELMDKVVVVGPEGESIVDAEEHAKKVLAKLIAHGKQDDLNEVLQAFEGAGFVMPMYGSVGND